MKTYPEINALDLPDARAALLLGEINANAITADARPQFAARMKALRERIRRLEWTAQHIARTQRNPEAR